MGPQGMEDMVAPMVRAFTTLPAVPFATVSSARRRGGAPRRGGRLAWTYAVNATPQERAVDLGAGPVKIAPWELVVSKTPLPR